MGKTTRKLFKWTGFWDHDFDNKFGTFWRTVGLIAIPIVLLILFL